MDHLLEKYTEVVTKEDDKGENYSLEIDSDTFIPGFEEQLVGMKASEEKDIQVTFKVKVNEIKQKRELDKDFFDDLSMEGVDTKEKLEKEIIEKIAVQKEVEAENNHINRLLEEISKNVDIDIPEGMVEEELNQLSIN